MFRTCIHPRRKASSPVVLALIGLVLLLVVSCTTGEPEIRGGAESEHAAASATPALTPITLLVGFVPNVQFAPIYVAREQGFFREAGIDLSIEHSFDETDGLTRIATNNLKFGMISGEQVLLARQQGAQVQYVYRWFQRFPVGIVAPADSGITDPESLRGKVVGVPGLYGASYIGLRALLHAAGMEESDLGRLESIGFDTAPVMCDGRVDAAVVYIANEPAQIAARCFPVTVIPVSDYANLVSNGLVTNQVTMDEQPDLVRAIVMAFDRGLALTISDPDLAYRVSRSYVENLGEDDPVQREVLARSIELWRAERLGLSDVEDWRRAAETLRDMGLLTGEVDVEAAFTNAFLPE